MQYKDLTAFSLQSLSKKLNSINIQINLKHQIPLIETPVEDSTLTHL